MKRFAQTVLDGFAALGVELDASSRLVRQANAYLDPKGILPQVIPPDHRLFQTAVEAMRDLRQVAYIFSQLSPVVARDILRSKITLLVKDNVLPQENPIQSRGRDFQCELFVAAICQRAGMFGELHEQPDIRCVLAGQKVGVAVKRMKTSEAFESRFEKQFRRGVKQITESCMPGVIAMDVTQSLNPTNMRVSQAVTDSHFLEVTSRLRGNVEKRFMPRMLEWTKGTGVLGLVLLEHHVREAPRRGWGLDLIMSSINLCPYNQRRCREFELFAGLFGHAVRNP